MSDPFSELEQLLIDALEDLEQTANVYPYAPAQLQVPALVIRTDDPWSEAASDEQPFTRRVERYAVVAVVSSSDPVSAQAQLRDLWHLVESALGSRWAWLSTSGITRASDGGVTYLAVTIRLTYSSEV